MKSSFPRFIQIHHRKRYRASTAIFDLYECMCGNTFVAHRGNVKPGHTKSCGCWQAESRVVSHTTHGFRGTPTYASWANMKNRCLNPKVPKYKDYGARGITVCKRWLDSFASFIADMGERPAHLTLDRINNDGNYEPGNCRWATAKQQVNNRRCSVAS